MNHAQKGPARQFSIETLESAVDMSPDMKVRLAIHRARTADDHVFCEMSQSSKSPAITSPGRRIMRARLAGKIVHYGVGQARRGEYGTPREVRAHERGMTRSGYQTIAERDASQCPPTERNDR